MNGQEKLEFREKLGARLTELETVNKDVGPLPWQFDERTGCVAVYEGERRDCLDDGGEFVFFQRGVWTLGAVRGHEWWIHPGAIAKAKAIALSHNNLDLLLRLARLAVEMRVKLDGGEGHGARFRALAARFDELEIG